MVLKKEALIKIKADLKKEEKLRVGISIGDLNGIGSEIILKTFEDARMLDFCTPVIFANTKLLSFYKKQFNLSLSFQGAEQADNIIDGKINVINVWKENLKINFGKQNLLKVLITTFL